MNADDPAFNQVLSRKAQQMLGLETTSPLNKQNSVNTIRTDFSSNPNAVEVSRRGSRSSKGSGKSKKQGFSFKTINANLMGLAANGAAKLPIQKSGYLYKKPFYGGAITGQQWKKKYFVLKDSFLFWLSKKPPGDNNFSIYPEGFIPLGGCVVNQEGKEGKYFRFSVTHSDFQGRVLWLKTDDSSSEALDWIKLLQSCRNATFDNAMLGDAQLMFLESKGSAQEHATLEFLESVQQKAAQEQEANEERQKLMEEQMREKKKYQKMLREVESKKDEEAKVLTVKQQEIEQAKERLKAMEMQKSRVMEQLSSAKRAVEHLQLAVLETRGPEKQQLLDDIDQLKEFLETEG